MVQCSEYQKMRVECTSNISTISEAKTFCTMLTAARKGHKKCMEQLIALGDSVNVTEQVWPNHGVLQLAVIGSHKHIVEVLMQHSVDLNYINREGKTALTLATERAGTDMVQLLLHNGAVICNDSKGAQKRLLINAVVRSKVPMCHMLLDYGVSVDNMDKWEKTALIYASALGKLISNLCKAFWGHFWPCSTRMCHIFLIGQNYFTMLNGFRKSETGFKMVVLVKTDPRTQYGVVSLCKPAKHECYTL